MLLLWVIALVGLTGAGSILGAAFSNKFGGGNSEAIRAQNFLKAHFPQAAGDSAQVVFHTTQPIMTPDNEAKITSLVATLAAMPHVSGVVSPLTPQGASQASRTDPTIAYATVQFDKLSSDLPLQSIKDVVNKAEAARAPGFDIQLGGPPVDQVDFAVPGKSEGIGIFAAILILWLAFGSFVAMGLPIIVALFGVGMSYGVLDIISHKLSVPTFAPELAAMIGLGVGIDYALFVATRFRNGLAEGLEPLEAVEVALATSGRAVLFAGCTVIISLIGLFLMGQPFVVGLAIGAIAAVVFVLVGSLTLLPALMGFFHKRLAKHAVSKRATAAKVAGRQTAAHRWSHFIQRHPWLAGIASLAVLVTLAIPLFSMRLAFTDDGNAPTSLTTRQAYDLLAKGFGPGSNGPLVLAVSLPSGSGGAALDGLTTTLRATPDVAAVVPPKLNQDGTAAVVIAIPKSAPEDAATTDLVKNLRSTIVPQAVQGTGLSVLVGGFTAGGIDFASQQTHRLPLVIALVVGLSFLLLMSVFRSLVVPIKAAIMNLISIGAAYGVIVAIFQWGWLGSVVGIGKVGPVDPWVPLFLFTILFGLSMDYEVFLLSRIREEWLRTGHNATAVADGLAATARVITAAAAIMVCVFGSFVIGDPLRVLKLFGLGLATAVLVDATLVRMVLVPSTMELLGNANWWLPRWLNRLLPKVNVGEGEEPETLEPAAVG
ncbi:MAG TPA: MMPL family transporter [Actinomycetota bacterium]|nr:MMPL family transporter [Actinomycetota bacterium]